MGVPTFYPLIHNEWIKTSKSIKIKNPYDNDTIAKINLVEGDFLDMAVESAQKGFQTARRLSGYERYEYLMKIAGGIRSRKDEIVNTIVEEGGKPVRFARNEVERSILTFTFSAEEARRIGGEVLPLDVTSQTKGYMGMTRRFPLGIILGITPFNFPLNLVAHKVGPAIASGNSIIIKPASNTPVTALKLAEIAKEAGLPPGILNVIPTSGKNAETLVKDGRIQMLSFTGSARIGWYLKSIAGKKHVALELGGSAGVIVDSDVNLDEVVPRLMLGAYAHAGQICISVQRIYIQDAIFDTFIQKFADEIVTHAVYGDPADPKTIIGPMIESDAAKKAEDWIKEAEKEGAKILIGGKREKNFLQPTVLTNTTPEMKAVCEEIFAPVVVIEPYSDFDSAIKMVNRSYYGLQAGIFTNDVRKIQKAYRHLDVGGVIINDYPTFRIDPMPYGGNKESGLGREGIRYAMEDMSQIKLMVLKS